MFFARYLPYFLCNLYVCHAHVQCHQVLDGITGLSSHGPSYTDCRQIVRHMPFPYEATDALASNTSLPRSVTPTHPFYPLSDVTSGSCRLILRCYESRMPMSIHDMEQVTKSGPPKTPLTEKSVRRLWTVQRDAAQQVLRDCISQELVGIHWSPIDLPETPFVLYVALVTSGRSWTSAREAEQRALLAGSGGLWSHERSWFYDGGVYHV